MRIRRRNGDCCGVLSHGPLCYPYWTESNLPPFILVLVRTMVTATMIVVMPVIFAALVAVAVYFR